MFTNTRNDVQTLRHIALLLLYTKIEEHGYIFLYRNDIQFGELISVL